MMVFKLDLPPSAIPSKNKNFGPLYFYYALSLPGYASLLSLYFTFIKNNTSIKREWKKGQVNSQHMVKLKDDYNDNFM